MHLKSLKYLSDFYDVLQRCDVHTKMFRRLEFDERKGGHE